MSLAPRVLFFLGLLCINPAIHARELAGVPLDDDCRGRQARMYFNGAGVRSKFFIKIYVGTLCASTPSRDASALLADTGPRRMRMHILYDKIPAQKIAAGWRDGFAANLEHDRFAALEQRLEQFNRMFPDLMEGDVVDMDYIPAQGTTVFINDRPVGRIEGEDFFSALLSVWIGQHPADEGLKSGLLGE